MIDIKCDVCKNIRKMTKEEMTYGLKRVKPGKVPPAILSVFLARGIEDFCSKCSKMVSEIYQAVAERHVKMVAEEILDRIPLAKIKQ